jgi:hypothetical protein
MNTSAPRIGLSADLFNAKGEPMFAAGPLSLLSNAGLAWDIVPTHQGRLAPSAFTDYEALMIGGSRLSNAELAGESGKLRVIARNERPPASLRGQFRRESPRPRSKLDSGGMSPR